MPKLAIPGLTQKNKALSGESKPVVGATPTGAGAIAGFQNFFHRIKAIRQVSNTNDWQKLAA
jgi:hypothetical protein